MGESVESLLDGSNQEDVMPMIRALQRGNYSYERARKLYAEERSKNDNLDNPFWNVFN